MKNNINRAFNPSGLVVSLVVLFGMGGAYVPLNAQTLTKPAPTFDISDEEQAPENPSESEAKEFKQLIEGMKSLTPAQLQELEEIGRQMEKKMEEKGLDPSNQDDIMKFLESEGLLQQPPNNTPQQPNVPEVK